LDALWRLHLHCLRLDLYPRHRMEKLGNHGIHSHGWWASHVREHTIYDIPIAYLNCRLYVVRYILTSWYNYRISNASDSLESLHKERDSTIEKLKLATKYNSTQQLLEKYGGAKPASKPKQADSKPQSPKNQSRRTSDRTSIAPPPTANIPRRQSAMNPENHLEASHPPQNHDVNDFSLAPPKNRTTPTVVDSAEFAPNAFDSPTQFAPAPISTEPKWYDRLVNALLGEDETRPDRRLALICTQCRLVNGLAPPGALTLEEVGKWKCSGCGSWNGVEALVSKPSSPAHSRQISAVENPKEVLEKIQSASPESPDSSS